jgi:hypothetical protein
MSNRFFQANMTLRVTTWSEVAMGRKLKGSFQKLESVF